MAPVCWFLREAQRTSMSGSLSRHGEVCTRRGHWAHGFHLVSVLESGLHSGKSPKATDRGGTSSHALWKTQRDSAAPPEEEGFSEDGSNHRIPWAATRNKHGRCTGNRGRPPRQTRHQVLHTKPESLPNPQAECAQRGSPERREHPPALWAAPQHKERQGRDRKCS